MKKYILVILLLSIVILTSCKESRYQDIKTISLSDCMIDNNHEDSIFNILAKKKYKIFAYLDSDACGPCWAKNIPTWYDIANYVEDKQDSVSLLVLFHPSKDQINQWRAFIEANPLDYPLFLDSLGIIKSHNKMITGSFFCLLKEDSVVLAGNPKVNWKQYKSILSNE